MKNLFLMLLLSTLISCTLEAGKIIMFNDWFNVDGL